MKNLLLILFSFLSVSCFAQDEVFFHNGTIAKGKVTVTTDSFTAGHFSEKILMKIRKEAAKRGGCIVLVLTQ